MDFQKINEKLEQFLESDLKPFKFTIDYNDGRPEGIIEYGIDEEDAKANLLKTHKYLQGKEEMITNVEPVKEDHEDVTMPFTMIHRSSEGPDVSGEVRFIPAPFGYEYDCSVKEFNGHGPQWSTIRTIEGIKVWFRNVLFEFGAKIVTIGNETWDIDDFPKDESLNESLNEREIATLSDRVNNDIDSSLTVKDILIGRGKRIEDVVKALKEKYPELDNSYELNNLLEVSKDLIKLGQGYWGSIKKNESVNEAEVTFEDRYNFICEDGQDLKQAIDKCILKYQAKAKDWDEEKQQNFCDRIMEVMEECELNLGNVTKRIK